MQKLRYISNATLIALLLMSWPQAATRPTSIARPIATLQPIAPSVEGVSAYRLSNGLQLFLLPDGSKPITTVMLSYGVGSRDELYGESGSAHLLEHMLFLGTTKVPSPRDDFRKRGMSQNATTLSDRTMYFESFPASDNNLEWALMMEADRMANISIGPAALAKEMTVVRNELERGEDAPANLLYQRMLSSAYRYHKYGEPVIGNRSDVEQVSGERLQALYKRYYRPDNAAIAIAGSFDPQKVLAWAQQYFGAIPASIGALERRQSVEPAQDGERSVTLRRPGELPLLLSSYHVPACTHPDYLPLAILSYLVGNTADGRIQKSLVETKAALGGSAAVDCLVEPGLFRASLSLPKDADLDSMEKRLGQLLEHDLLDTITDAEIERAKAAYISGTHNTMSNVHTLAGMVLNGVQLADWRNIFYQRDRLETITPADVRRVAASYLKPINRVNGRFIPTDRADKVEIPVAPDLREVFAHYQGRAAVAEGELFAGNAANIASRTLTGHLPNGLKYALLPRKLRAGKVYARLDIRFGDERSLMGLETTGDSLDELLGKATVRRDKVAIASELNRLKSGISLDASEQGLTASLQSENGQLDSTLDLLRELLREPLFKQNEFDIVKNQLLESNAAAIRSSDPDRLAKRALDKHFAGTWPRGDVRHYTTLEELREDIDKLSLADAQRFYQQFYGVGEGELVMVGDFDPKQMVAKLTQLFGDWRSPVPYRYAAEPFVAVPAAYFRTQTADRANATYLARANLPIGQQHPDRLAVQTANELLGGGDKSRLFQRIRTQEGLSYGVYSNVGFGRLDPWGSWQISATYAPENRAKVETLIKEEIERARKDGFTQAELDELKSGQLQAMRANLSGEGFQLGMLHRLLRYQEPLERAEQEIAALERLSLADVNRAMRTYLDSAMLSVSVAGNFEKEAPTTALAGKPLPSVAN